MGFTGRVMWLLVLSFLSSDLSRYCGERALERVRMEAGGSGFCGA